MQACLRNYFNRPLAFLNPLKAIPSHVALQPRRSISTSTVNVARSIRNAVANGHVDDGYHLFVQSYAAVRQKATSLTLKETNVRPRPRYLAHVLLHALHRTQKPLSAAKLAGMCMQRGIQIHERTFDTVFAGVSPPCDVNVRVTRPTPTQKLPSMSSITAAVGLLKAARNSGHRRHSWMYDRVINAFLLQGEVLTAAFLFITLVKEWNARRHANAVEDETKIEEPHLGPGNIHSCPVVRRRHPIDPYIPIPQGVWLHNISAAIEGDANCSLDDAQPFSLRTLDALVALVKILEGEYQHVPGRWRLLQTLKVTLSIPTLSHAIREKFHGILLGICQRPGEMSGLDLVSYHVLLQYALQDRKSVDLGASILQALCDAHNPTSTTYNILLHDLILLGERSAVEVVTRVLETRNCYALGTLPTKDIPLTLKEQTQQKIFFSLSSRPVPLPDESTAVMAMSEAIERGDPNAACTFVIQLFPVLGKSESQSGDRYGGRGAVLRASKLSSHFWTKAQHAAANAGWLRLSMRIWRLIMRAELIQYHPTQGNMVPCLYSAEAYNSLLNLLLSHLQRIQEAAQVDDLGAGRAKHLSIQYHRLLEFVQRVIVSLRDRTIDNRMIAGFEFDDALAGVLFAIVEMVLRLEQRLPPPDRSVALALKKDTSEWYDIQSRSRRTLGVIRKMMHHYGIPHPGSVQQLGFGCYSNKASDLRVNVTAPSTSGLPERKRKQPAFRVTYPGTAVGPSAVHGSKARKRGGGHSSGGSKVTNRLVEILYQVRDDSLKPSA